MKLTTNEITTLFNVLYIISPLFIYISYIVIKDFIKVFIKDIKEIF